MAKLGKYIRQVRGVSYKPVDVREEKDPLAVPILRANNIDDGELNFDELVYVDKKCVKDAQMLKKGDILICASSGSKKLVGKAGQVRENYSCSFGAFCKLIRTDDSLQGYLGHFFQSPYYRQRISQASEGANINNIRSDDIDNLEIVLPSHEECFARVTVLDKLSRLIKLRKEQLEYCDELVKSQFIEMFGTGHDEKCKTVMIGDVCKFQQGTQIPVEMQIEEQKTGYKRFLRIIDYTQAPQTPRFVNVPGREIDERSVVIVRYGATAGFVGRGYKGILANNLFEVVPDEKVVSKEFLYLALKHGTFERDIHEKAFGAAMPALSFSMMKDIPIVTPSYDKQIEFTRFVEQTDKSKNVFEMEVAA